MRCADRAPGLYCDDAPEQLRVQHVVRVFHGSPPHVVSLQFAVPLSHDAAEEGVSTLRKLVDDVGTVDEHALRKALEFRPAEILGPFFLLRGTGETYKTIQTLTRGVSEESQRCLAQSYKRLTNVLTREKAAPCEDARVRRCRSASDASEEEDVQRVCAKAESRRPGLLADW